MSITTFADLMKAPNSEKIFLVKINPTEQILDWTQYSGSIYYAPMDNYDLQDIKEDDSTLSATNSIDAITAGSYYYNGSVLYLQASSGTPYAKTIISDFNLYYDNIGKEFNDNYYEPFVAEIPNINQNKIDMFWGVSIINNGSLGMYNNKGHFDNIYEKYNWNNRSIEIKAGGEDLPYSEYETMFTGVINEIHLGTALLDIGFIDNKEEWNNNIELNSFNQTDYPDLEDEDVGKMIPLIYGTVYNIPIICTTKAKGTATNLHSFKMADTSLHSIQEITNIKVNGVKSSIQSPDLNAATFNISTSTFTPGDEVTGDIKGSLSGTILIENGIDVLKEISSSVLNIDYAENWDTATVSTAKTDASVFPIGLFINESPSGLEGAEQIMKSVMGNFYVNNEGKYAISIWSTDIPSDPDLVDEIDIMDGTFEAEKSLAEIRKTIRVGWHKNWATGRYAYSEQTNADTERLYGIKRTRTIPTLLSSEAGAELYKQRMAFLHEGATILMSFTTKFQLAQKNIGDRFSLSFRRRTEDNYHDWVEEKIVEIQEIEKDFDNNEFRIIADDLKGVGQDIGNWVADDLTFPARLGGGAATTWDDDWSDAQKGWILSQAGFWSNDDGFISSGKVDSLNKSKWW